MPKDLPSPDVLRKVLHYDQDTGKLFWRARPVAMFADGSRTAAAQCAMWNGRYAGKEALTALDTYGYRSGRIFGRMILAHRVIWAIVHGEWPPRQIDHINGVRDDNRIANLRTASSRENMRNQMRRSDNTSGVAGVSWQASSGKWRAYISDNTGHRHLGCFDNKSDAIAIRAEAEKRLGYHENHGR